MPPTWLTILAWISLTVSVASGIAIALDIRRGHRQPMWIMELVWPITALYTGPVGLWAYHRLGRVTGRNEPHATPRRSFPASVAIGVMHCGSGCTLGDMLGAVVVAGIGLQVLGLALWSELAVDFAFAFTLGIAFQYFAIAPMRGLGLRDGLVAALKADTLSLTAFEVGMFGWMIPVQLVLFPAHLHPDEPAYWLMMQVAMLLGFATAYPVNWWLLRVGIKERM